MNKKNSNNNYLLDLFAKRLKEVRTNLDLTATDMATNCDMTYAAYSRFERAEGGSLENFLRLCNFISDQDYNLAWLIKEDNTSENAKNEDMFFFSFDRSKSLKKLEKIKNIIKEVEDELNI